MTKRKICRGGTVIWTDSGCVWWNVPGTRLVPAHGAIMVEDAMVPVAARQIARELVRAADVLERQEKKRKQREGARQDRRSVGEP